MRFLPLLPRHAGVYKSLRSAQCFANTTNIARMKPFPETAARPVILDRQIIRRIGELWLAAQCHLRFFAAFDAMVPRQISKSEGGNPNREATRPVSDRPWVLRLNDCGVVGGFRPSNFGLPVSRFHHSIAP